MRYLNKMVMYEGTVIPRSAGKTKKLAKDAMGDYVHKYIRSFEVYNECTLFNRLLYPNSFSSDSLK